MKRNNIIWLAALALGLTACEEDPEGTSAGGDSAPKVTIYTYSVEDNSRPDASDNSFTARFAANSTTSEAYFALLSAADYEAKSKDNAALADYVVSNGEKISEISGYSFADKTIEAFGQNVICAVAKNGGSQTVSTANLSGHEWVDITTGTFEFGAMGRHPAQLPAVKTTLQACKDDATLFRLKDVFGEGSSLKFNLMTGDEGKTTDGTFVRVDDQPTIGTMRNDTVTGLPLNFRVRDIATWLNQIEYATEDGYSCIFYDNHDCEFTLQYRDAYGSLNFDYDIFTADN